MDEMDVEAVDRGDELRQGVQLRLGLAPVVRLAPVLDERLQLFELNALGKIVDGFALGKASRSDASAQLIDLGLRNLRLERPD